MRLNNLSIQTINTLHIFLALSMLVGLAFLQSNFAQAQSVTAGKSGLPLPRYASLKSNKVNLRVGPGTDYKIDWLYQRKGLPMEIIQEFDTWRKVRDPEGSEGWVLHSLLSGKRTAIIKPWERDKVKGRGNINAAANKGSDLIAHVEPGVLVTLVSCDEQWCEISYDDSAQSLSLSGYILKSSLWGVYPDEAIEK